MKSVFIVLYPDNDDMCGFIEAVCATREVAEHRRQQLINQHPDSVDRYYIEEHKVDE